MKRSVPCAGIRQNIYAASIVLIGNFKKFHYDFDFLYYSFSILNLSNVRLWLIRIIMIYNILINSTTKYSVSGKIKSIPQNEVWL